MIGRRKPYTEIGISRVPCARCGAPACYQWKCCSNHGRWIPICAQCDIDLNDLVLTFLGHPEKLYLMELYIAKARKMSPRLTLIGARWRIHNEVHPSTEEQPCPTT